MRSAGISCSWVACGWWQLALEHGQLVLPSWQLRKKCLELRSAWLGKGDQRDTPMEMLDGQDPKALAIGEGPAAGQLVEDNPSRRTAAALNRGGANRANPSEPAARTAKQQKSLDDYLKQLNAKTNLLDLCTEVLSDRRLQVFGWMILGLKDATLYYCCCTSVFLPGFLLLLTMVSFLAKDLQCDEALGRRIPVDA